MRYKLLSILCVVALLISGFATAFAEPTQDQLNELQFRITGQDGYDQVYTYKDFIGGKLTLEGLTPGKYAVTEVNYDKMPFSEDYDFSETESVYAATFEVKDNTTTNVDLLNVYIHYNTVPSVTPTPPAGPTPTPTIPPYEDDVTTYVTVNKIWNDNNNKDGNRPASVTVRLYADGRQIQTAAVSSSSGWTYTFKNLPRYRDDMVTEIKYTVSEDAVNLYKSSVNGYNITNTYVPELTSASVRKIWDDNNNKKGLRPKSIVATLSNGMTVTLNAANNWEATIEDLPAIVNGKRVTYTWHEQTVFSYVQSEKSVSGNNTTFTNRLRVKPEDDDDPTPSHGEEIVEIPKDGVPLGVEIIINHVGDCFD